MSGGIPKLPPKICGSAICRTMVTTPYKISSPIPKEGLPSKNIPTAQGINTVPVPKIGKMSTAAMTNAIKKAYGCRKIKSPIKTSEKVNSHNKP